MSNETKASGEAGGSIAASAPAPRWDVGRILLDTRVAELLCRYPNDPVVVLEAVGDREVTVHYQGQQVCVRVRNADEGIPGRRYLLIADGFDRGLYQVDGM